MSTRVENINRGIIEWAIIRNGNSPEEFYLKNPVVESWINGEKLPTIKQLESFTHKVHVPFGYMFLPSPPEENIPIPFFRTGKRGSDNKVSLNVYHTIQIIKNRQEWLTEYLEDIEFPDLDFVGKFSKDNDYNDIVTDIRNVLDLKPNWAEELRNWNDALGLLTSKIEDAGIIVTFNGVVGNNTRRVIDVNECRGFVLVNKKAPFMFINAADAKAAQIFTLIHELAHIWLGESAGFNSQNLLPAEDLVEKLCDRVAAELLVPQQEFQEKWNHTRDFKILGRIFKVSPVVIARRALDMEFIDFPYFLSFYNRYMDGFKNRKEQQASGGDFYANSKKRVSVRFASFVNSAVKENRLLYRDAYKLTNLSGDTYERFVTWL